MYFTITSAITSIETIAAGSGVRERFRLATGELLRAEVHWYECAGIGKRELKIKRFLEGDLQ